MPRPPDPQKRQELLRAVTAHLETVGIGDVSLAPLAEAVGTSKRMLIYYFGDRSALLSQAFEYARPDAAGIFSGIDGPESVVAASMSLWHALTRGDQKRSVRLLLQVLSLSTTDPSTYGQHAREAVGVMLDAATAAFEDAGFVAPDAAARATLVVSGMRGLCQDLLVAQDRERVDAACRLLVDAAVYGARG